jgi:NADP-dependent 3-hydroxy acid dehydrogenase YdfG
MDLQNKIAVITGISKGIGKELALQLLEKGAKVAGWGMNQSSIQHENLFFAETNVRQYESVQSAWQQTKAHFGGEVHILINNAGLGYFGYLEEMEMEKWHEMFEVNVNGTYYCCREVIPQMKAQKYGHIINISSIAGLEGMPQVAAYCGTKHAVRGITDSLFRELRDFNIKVTGVYPGSTKTEFFNNAEGIKPHDYMMMPTDVAKQIINAIEAPDNFLVNTLEFRPLQPKGPKLS